MLITSADMDSGQSKNKGLVVGSDDGLESSIIDMCERSSDDIYCTANSDMLIENPLKLQPEYQNLKERDERPRTGSEKNRDEYGVLEQKIRQFHIGITTLKEENETPLNMRIDESDQRLNSQEHIASFQTTADTDLDSQTDSKLMQKESSEGIDVFQKENINNEAELQDEIRKGQKLQRAIEDLQIKLVSLEDENKVLKTELQRPVQKNDGVKKVVCDLETNGGWGGVSTLETDKMKCKSSEQEEQNSVVSRQNDKNVLKECNNVQEELLLQESKSSRRTEASCELHGMKSSRDGTSNLLMENEHLIKENSGQFDWMQEQITLLLQEVQAKTELVDVQQKQIGDLLQALVNSNCENTRLTSEHNKCMEDQGDINTFQAELEQAQEENQKLQKELSTKLTDLKNLHIMLSTLGREKEIMAAELVLKTRLLGDMEEHLNDLKEQNKTLSNRLEAYARENKTKNRDTQETISSLQNRNKLLAEQVLKTSEGYRAFKRKSKELREQNSGFKREIAHLKSSILKQEKFTRVLVSERAALLNEITWGKQQLHILLKKCECFQQETESLTEERLTKPDRQKSLKEEFVLLEQLLLRFKEEIVCLKADPDGGVKEHQKLKEEMAMLQNELLYLRTENSLLIQEKKLNAGRDASIKSLEDGAHLPFYKDESLQAEVVDINMSKSKLKLDDATDLRNQQLIDPCITQKQGDAVSSLKMAPGSEVSPP